uniref:Uncharacterized protein n=1 Tax=Brassica campestris TaxID=3711 RepID=A0A3P5YLP1_BRACM|nr:unnamed protein product [Brassica rapa]
MCRKRICNLHRQTVIRWMSSVQTETGHAFLELKSLKTRLSYFIILQLP